VKSLELVVMGETILPPSILSFILRQRRDDEATTEYASKDAEQLQITIDGETSSEEHGPRLSAREQCILRYLIEGQSNKTIARKNDIAEATVKVHVKAILRKIRVNNRTQAAIWAMNHDALLGGPKREAESRLSMAVASPLRSGLGNCDHEDGQSTPLAHGARQAASVSNGPKPRLGLG
jgi:two-component system nitrate/nitrite response regulator NarL